ncbi:hypothetical protein, partial [Nonomuraea sp. NPDC049400]|uniref:hypothetical protein n=1 Tax=Nonomuraea sp. NPDC049400 TaxID=3364352 RepID=UPI0037ACDC74
ITGLHRDGGSGYQGHHPDEKPQGGKLTLEQKRSNRQLTLFALRSSRRSHMSKSGESAQWRFRGPLEKFQKVPTTVIGLHFFAHAFE